MILCGDLVPREYMQQGGRYSCISIGLFSKSLIFAMINPYIEAGVHQKAPVDVCMDIENCLSTSLT